MLFALVEPIAFAGLLLAFLLALTVRALVQHLLARRLLPTVGRLRPLVPRRDVDVFGAVGALVGGTGWGRRAPTPPAYGIGRPPDVGSRATVVAAGPLAVLLLGLAVLLTWRLAVGRSDGVRLYSAADLIRGGAAGLPAAEMFTISLAAGLVAFAVLAIVPLPPLDGWELLTLAVRRPGAGFARARHWLDDNNVGIAILLAALLLPLYRGYPLLVFLLDLIVTPILRLVG